MDISDMVPDIQGIGLQLYQAWHITGRYAIRMEPKGRLPDSDLNEIIDVYAIPANKISSDYNRMPHIEIMADTMFPSIIGYDFEITIYEPSQPYEQPKIEVHEDTFRLSKATLPQRIS